MKYRKIAVKKLNNEIKSSTKDSVLDELLALRGLDSSEKIEKFLNPSRDDFISPYAFCDMEKAVKRINSAIEKGEKILVWGDFDCDGVTSSTILYKALCALEADVDAFIPDRLAHGHGLNSSILLKYCAKEKIKLVITVDCGISDHKEIGLLKSFNVDTILTDHHSADGDELPLAYAIINPQVKGAIDEGLSVDDIQSLTYNSGSIVAYKLAMALLEDVKDDNLKDELLTIASSGAIADVVPLLGENRAMVTVALNLLNTKGELCSKPIYKLLSKNIENRDITSYDIGFILAPRINAVGRLANAKLSFDFLNCDDEVKLNFLITELDNYNAIRQSKCNEVYQEVKTYLESHKEEQNKSAVILMNENWHVGVIGIVAAKIVEEFDKPCFLMTKDENNNARCSIRSNDLINVYQVLKENSELFSGFGGHKLAGGFSFNLETTSFEIVKSALLKTIDEMIPKESREDILYADIELKANDIELNLLDSLAKLEPYGQENPQPLCAMFDVNFNDFKVMGKDKNHLKLNFSCDDKILNAVKWGENEILVPKGAKCDIAFYPRLNDFNGEKSVQLELVDVYSSDVVKNNSSELKIFDHRKKTGILEQISSYFERDGLDIAVWVKTAATREILSKYQKIKDNFIESMNTHRGLMLFDYPSNIEELKEIFSNINPKKIHLMNTNIDENLENYIKQVNGMIKYATNHLDGNIELVRFSRALGVSENFIQIVLEILEDIGSIEIIDINKIKYLKPFSYDNFKQSSMFEVLNDEFENIIEFKKTLLNCDIKEFEQMIS